MVAKQIKPVNWRGKRILICQPIMHLYGGSIIVSLELATYFISQGATVEIYTLTLSPDVAADCKKAGTKVHLVSDEPKLKLQDYDLIWSHSEVLPLSIIEELPTLKDRQAAGKKIPYFVYAHLSALPIIPDEWPWNYQLENKTADLVLYMAKEARENQSGTLSSSLPVQLFRNPAPTTFVRETVSPKRKLKSVLIVSNHVPPELFEAKKLLEERGIQVDHLGNGGTWRLISPRDIHSHDVVITIAKTVQYALVAQTPVYVYDHWGGVGYLTPENYDGAKKRNFSGRGSSRKSATEIADELIDGFPEALARQNQAIADDQDDYYLDRVITRYFQTIEHRPKGAFPEQQVKALVAAQGQCALRFAHQQELAEKRVQISELEKRVAQQDAELTELRRQADEYERVRGVKGAARNLARAGRDYLRKAGGRG